MTQEVKLFFIGRRHGVIPLRARPWKLERQRHGELDGFKAAQGITRTYSPANADVIFVRNSQDYTGPSDVENIERRIGKFRSKKLILNDIKYFEQYNSKDTTFAVWKKNGVSVPAFKTLDAYDTEQALTETVSDFMSKYPSTILRTTNDESGVGMFFLHQEMSLEQITEIVKECMACISENKKTKPDSRMMAVEYIGDLRSSEYQYLCRAYCVGQQIVCTRCITGKHNNVHAKSMGAEDFDEFVTMNETLTPQFYKEPFRSQILKAVDCLGPGMTAIDFIYKDGAVYFLEINPMWGGGNKYGDEVFMSLLKTNQPSLQNRMPDIYKLLDGNAFYKSFYGAVRDYSNEYSSQLSEADSLSYS